MLLLRLLSTILFCLGLSALSYGQTTLQSYTFFIASAPFVVDPPKPGRLIGYLAGWKHPPSPTALAQAGYTHILIAFGVFNTQKPGSLTPAFEQLSKDYIKELQGAGLKVMLSLGGPETHIALTSINFHQVH